MAFLKVNDLSRILNGLDDFSYIIFKELVQADRSFTINISPNTFSGDMPDNVDHLTIYFSSYERFSIIDHNNELIIDLEALETGLKYNELKSDDDIKDCIVVYGAFKSIVPKLIEYVKGKTTIIEDDLIKLVCQELSIKADDYDVIYENSQGTDLVIMDLL
jgi:hypothetical protein